MSGTNPYEAEARERWGDTEAFAESAKRTAGYTEADWLRVREEADAITGRLADLFAAGSAPDDEQVLEAAEDHRRHIERWFYPCSPEMHAGLGRLYTEDSRFAAYWDQHLPGLATFVEEAFRANASRPTEG